MLTQVTSEHHQNVEHFRQPKKTMSTLLTMTIQETNVKEIVHVPYCQQGKYVKANVNLMVNRKI